MKVYRIYLAIAILVLASLACQAVTGGPNNTPTAPPVNDNTGSDVLQPTPANSNENNNDSVISTDFPMTPDAFNVTEAGGSLIFYTKLSLEDTMQFYRGEYTSKGYTEREILTVVSDGTFSMVFDGDPSGKSVVVQSVDLGDGSRTVSIRLEEV
jgi:hypothetical protein